MGMKLIPYLLLLLVTIQFLPVKQLGMALYKNQFTEELNDSITKNKAGEQETKDPEEKKIIFLNGLTSNNEIVEIFFKNYHTINNISFLSRNLDDILTPPPLV